jgi:hypothetical protein
LNRHPRSRGIRAMEFSNTVKPGREIGIERDEMDYVSRWILRLAIGMIVLGTAFAVLDWCDSFLTSRRRRNFRM